MGAGKSLNGREKIRRRKVKNESFLRPIFSCPFRLFPAPTYCTWVSEDEECINKLGSYVTSITFVDHSLIQALTRTDKACVINLVNVRNCSTITEFSSMFEIKQMRQRRNLYKGLRKSFLSFQKKWIWKLRSQSEA